MNYLSPEDQQLIAFLKEYHPLPPATTVNLENKILSELETRDSTKESLWSDRRIIGFAGMITAGIVAIWAGIQVGKPSPHLAEQSPEAAVLESFLVDSWQDTTGESLPTQTPTSTTDWLLLDYSEPEITVSDH